MATQKPDPKNMMVSKRISQLALIGGILMAGQNAIPMEKLTQQPLRQTFFILSYGYLAYRSVRGMAAFNAYAKDTTRHTMAEHHRQEATADWNAGRMLLLAAADFATQTPEAHIVKAIATGLIGSGLIYSMADHQKKGKALNAPTAD